MAYRWSQCFRLHPLDVWYWLTDLVEWQGPTLVVASSDYINHKQQTICIRLSRHSLVVMCVYFLQTINSSWGLGNFLCKLYFHLWHYRSIWNPWILSLYKSPSIQKIHIWLSEYNTDNTVTATVDTLMSVQNLSQTSSVIITQVQVMKAMYRKEVTSFNQDTTHSIIYIEKRTKLWIFQVVPEVFMKTLTQWLEVSDACIL